MLTVVVSLALCVFVVAAVFVAMFVDVGFGAPAPATLRSDASPTWRPPLVLGRRLLNWAAAEAEAITADRLRGRRSPTTAAVLAGELQDGATTAIDQPWQREDRETRVGCPAYCHSLIAVTPPEAIRAADYIRTIRPAEAGRIRDHALHNVRLTAGMDSAQYRASAARCPLMGNDNACLAYAVRPLRCRGWCEHGEQPTAEPAATLPTEPAAFDAQEYEPRGHLVTQGAERGFSRALESAGLDGNLYDLNSALLTALDEPNAAERWIRGDRLFENCKRYQSGEQT